MMAEFFEENTELQPGEILGGTYPRSSYYMSLTGDLFVCISHLIQIKLVPDENGEFYPVKGNTISEYEIVFDLDGNVIEAGKACAAYLEHNWEYMREMPKELAPKLNKFLGSLHNKPDCTKIIEQIYRESGLIHVLNAEREVQLPDVLHHLENYGIPEAEGGFD